MQGEGCGVCMAVVVGFAWLELWLDRWEVKRGQKKVASEITYAMTSVRSRLTVSWARF